MIPDRQLQGALSQILQGDILVHKSVVPAGMQSALDHRCFLFGATRPVRQQIAGSYLQTMKFRD